MQFVFLFLFFLMIIIDLIIIAMLANCIKNLERYE